MNNGLPENVSEKSKSDMWFELAFTILFLYLIYDPFYIFAITYKTIGFDFLEPKWHEYVLDIGLFYIALWFFCEFAEKAGFAQNKLFKKIVFILRFPFSELIKRVLKPVFKTTVQGIKFSWPLVKWLIISGIVIFGIVLAIQGISSLSVHTLLVIIVLVLIFK